MREHRLIERMVALMGREANRVEATQALDPAFIDLAAGFIKNYADRCHHGKEEDILFRDLKGKDLPAELKQIMEELVAEHKLGRKMTKELLKAKESALKNKAGALAEVIAGLKALVDFYPRHIEKEDKRFFYPCMEFFDRKQKDAMLAEFWEFDRRLVHEEHENTVSALEGVKGN
jgi:hemerythrin-like domain-containing protein